ncbi:MAG: ParB/RepB/Spo0J family partition protein, partial [Oscillospiraceae bacterium]
LHVEGNVVSVDIDRIKPSPFQARSVFDTEDIMQLSKSILENGLLQPITIRRIDKDKQKGQFEIIAGERRLRACKLAGLKKITAIICEMDDLISATFGYIENSQRTDLNPFEQARGIKELLKLWQTTQEDAAKRLGMTQPTLCNKLRLLTLTEEEQELCIKLSLTERHARAALAIEDVTKRTSLLKRAGERQMSVAGFEQLIKTEQMTPVPKPKRAYMIKDVRIFANTINRAINFMRNAGVDATAERQDTSEYIEYVVRIPLGQANGTTKKTEMFQTAVN